MQPIFRTVSLTLFLFGILIGSTPTFAQCDAIDLASPPERSTHHFDGADARSFVLSAPESGLLVIEAEASLATRGRLWLAEAKDACAASTDGFRVVRASGHQLFVVVHEPSQVPIQVGYSSERDSGTARVNVAYAFLPAGDLSPSSHLGIAKNGSGGSGSGGSGSGGSGNGDGDGSEEADRDIPPAAPESGGGTGYLGFAKNGSGGSGSGGNGGSGNGDGDGSEEADRDIPPVLGFGDGGIEIPLTSAMSTLCAHHADRLGAACAPTLEAGQVGTFATGRRAIVLDAPSRLSLGIAATADVIVHVTDTRNRVWVDRQVVAGHSEAVIHLALPAGRYDLRVESPDGMAGRASVRYSAALDVQPIR